MGGRAWTTVLLVIVLSGCGGGPMVWRETSLNQLSVGMPKDEGLRLYPNQYTDSSGRRRDVEGMQIRPARTSDGRQLEVGEVVLNTGTSNVPYWFLFEKGRLIQWGRSRDWQAVAKRYHIDLNAAPGAPR